MQPLPDLRSQPPPPPDLTAVAEALRAVDRAAGVSELPPPVAATEEPESSTRLGRARALVKACDQELLKTPEPRRAARLHYEAARLLEVPLWDFGAAGQHYEAARKYWPDHIPTLRGLRRVQAALGRHTAIPALLDAEIRATKNPQQRALLFYEKGCLYRDFLEDRREARAAFAAAVELDPTNPSLLKAVALTEHQAAGWGNLDKAHELAATALSSDSRHRAAILVERAHLADQKARDLPLATALYEVALKADAQVPRAVRELKRLLYVQKRWHELVDVLSADSAQTSDPAGRARMLYQSGRVLGDRLGNVEAAIAALEAANASAPDDATILDELTRHYELAGRWDALAAGLERLAARTVAASEKVQLLHRLGVIYAERLDNDELAIERQRQAYELDATFSPALTALTALYRKREGWRELADIYAAEASVATTSEQQADALFRVAELCEQQLGELDLAVQQYQRSLAVSPDYAPAFKALVRIFHEAKDYPRLAELYQREIERASDSETKRTYLFKLGRLEEDDMRLPAHAVATYRRVLELDSQNVEAIHSIQRAAERSQLWEELCAALELEANITKEQQVLLGLWHRIAEIFEKQVGDYEAALNYYRRVIARDDTHVPALHSLARVYTNLGRWEELIELYRVELKAVPRPASKAALLFKMGQLCERQLGNESEAVANYRKAIQFDPSHLPSLRALERLLSRRGEWKDVVRLIQLEAAATTDPEGQARAKYRVGEIYENRLNSADLALVAYDEALSMQPRFEPALEARTRLLELASDHERLLTDLKRAAAATDDPHTRIDALLGQAKVLEEVKNAAEAAKLYEEVLAMDGNQIGALLSLERIYADLGRHAELARVYELQAQVFTHPQSRVAALRELGRVQETHRLTEPGDVIKTYLSIAQLAPADAEVLATLERLAISQQDWTLVSQVDSQLAASSEDAMVIAAHHTRVAEALEAEGDPAALRTYRLALAHDGESLGATRGLSRLARASSDPELLGEAAEYEARVARNGVEASGLLVQSAGLREAAGDRLGAARDVMRALELNPDHAQAAARLVVLLNAEQRHDELIQSLSHAAGTAKNADRRADLWIELAKVQVQELGDSGAAIASAQRAVKERPRYPRGLMTLANLYAGAQQWREAVRWFRQALTTEPPPALAEWANLELARILNDRLGDPRGAVEILQQVLTTSPNHRAALAQLTQAQIWQGELDKAAESAGRLVEASDNLAQRGEALLQVAQLQARRGLTDEALDAYAKAVALSGLEGPAATEFKTYLIGIAAETGSAPWDRYAKALSEYLSTHSIESADMGGVHLELARILDDQLGQSPKALGVLRQGIASAADNDSLRLEMAQRLRRTGSHEQASSEYLLLLAQQPLQPVYWRELSQAFKDLGRQEQSRLALGPLLALNAATQLEQATYGMRPPRPEAAQPGAFEQTAFRVVNAHPGEDAATTELVAALSTALHKLYTPDWSVYGIDQREDRISARSNNPLRVLAERVAMVFGVEEFELFVHRLPRRRIDVELTETPTLLVPRQVASLSESLQVFLLARVFSSIARKTYGAERLNVQQLRYLIAAAIRQLDPNHKVDFVDGETLSVESRRVYKALPWRSRKPLEEAVKAYTSGGPQTPLVDWKFRERVTAVRAGTILADDMAGVVALLTQTAVDLSAEDAEEAPSEELLAAVLGFSVSDHSMTLRKRLNLVIS
jgi:tetratricopeptide (TPR) repeat protein